MSTPFSAQHLNVRAFAQSAATHHDRTLLQNLERITQESQGLAPENTVDWSAHAELRPSPGAEDQVWLHLTAQAQIPLTCQRCLDSVQIPLQVDQWYRFVESEDIAMVEDHQSEEDLLVLTPQFDLLALLEDELLMALPLVPVHDTCLVTLKTQVGEDDMAAAQAETPHPFAALAQLAAKPSDPLS